MAKKNSPDKGFIGEIAKSSVTQQAAKPKSGFSWSRPVVTPDKPNDMNTTHRAQRLTKVKATKEFTTELAKHIDSKRGKK